MPTSVLRNQMAESCGYANVFVIDAPITWQDRNEARSPADVVIRKWPARNVAAD
jgi:hypothetical protein